MELSILLALIAGLITSMGLLLNGLRHCNSKSAKDWAIVIAVIDLLAIISILFLAFALPLSGNDPSMSWHLTTYGINLMSFLLFLLISGTLLLAIIVSRL